ncbi:MAG TPA: SGNH/GDSL hydrolase family protein [Ktedonobacterales bacterium]|nr:SGNH/GDSL hydrolase family protein [Ktedonobacterales bacterium]
MARTGDNAASAGGSGARPTSILAVVALSVVLVAALVGVDLLVLSRNDPAQAIAPHYYMALGDSLSFGYQPNLDFSSGFADDIFNDLRFVDVTGIVNYACAGETTDTFIHGGCVGHFAHHGSYTGAQLTAAVNFVKKEANRGHVSPITLEIGSNDVIPDWDPSTCTASPNAAADLAHMDDNLTKVILPQLVDALQSRTNANNGDLHLLNYYNPYAKECPDSAQFVHTLNDHLAADAAQFKIPVVDIYGAFGGDANMASNICNYTWICDSRFHDIHPTNTGYKVIAKAVELALGLPGMGPLPGAGVPAPAGDRSAPEASFRRPAAGAA